MVTVNTVAMWPDLDDGLRELHRVVRRGGTVLIAWHGGSAPSKIGQRLRLPDNKLDRIDTGLRELFSEVSRDQLTTLDIFRATR